MDATIDGASAGLFSVNTPEETGALDAKRYPKIVADRLARLVHRSQLVAELTRPSSPPSSTMLVFNLQDEFQKLRPEMALALTEYLAVKLAQKARFRLVPRTQLKERLREEKAKSYKECFDSSCQIALGKALAAQKIVSAKFIPAGQRCIFTATIFDLRTETTDAGASAKTNCKDEELFEAIDQLVANLVGEHAPLR